RPQCLPGTRLEILERAVEWALSDSSQNIFWLYGVAGSGKSTVSTTIAEHFRGISRLGAHLFFERGKSEPSSVICTLAYKLALFDSSVARHVLEAIEQDNDIALAPGSTQFAKLINDPLVQVGKAMQGPVIIVLDALDECGTGSSRKHLLELLRERLPTLPRNFRFFITSRRELDIDRAFSSRLECICAVELVHDSTTCKDDVHRYIDYEMRKVFAKNTLQISGDWQTKMDHLGGAADGLFVWASTAVKMVDCDDPIRKLKELTSRSHNLSGLNHLYNSVLRDSGILFDDEASKTRFSRILGLIILGKYPLTDNMIDELLGYSDERPSRLTLSRLRSVLVYTPGTPIRFCHTSFRDYLLSPDCKSDPWFIDPEAQNEFITSRCFDVMRDKLQFNICDIESSYISNDRIPDLPDRIKAKIPPHLDYACLFWSQHLQDLQFTHALLGVLTEFLHERLFYWLEVMSLLRRVNSASPAFLRAINWVSSRNAEVLAFLRDARRIITRFALPISESIPHIYTIMVWDIESRQAVKCLEGHVGAVNSVALSPDGKHIVSGSDDETIRIWNVEKGQTICDPRGGHVDAVWSVAFSHDGTRVASGAADNTIRIWESGQCLSVPFEGHDDEVCSVAFSPDGKRVVSGSDDRTIRIWDVVTGQVVCGPLKGHTDYVRSVAFSPDGTRVVSGSEDGTVRIWDAESVHVVSGHFEGHVDEVTSVSFSPSGRLIASGSDDTTIRIWEAESGKAVSGPFKGHSSYVLSVAFSPDGRRLASGSSDRTIRVWDTVRGNIVSGPFKGHEEQVFSVCFSSDGTRIVSGSEDQTLRIWDAHSGETISGPFRGHESWVVSVAFSPDGRRVVSGSGDKTIIIWDSESGEVISGPLRGHTDWVWSVAFSSNGTRVASGSDDTTVLIWNAESGQVAAGPLKGHTSSVRSVAFSPDGARVVSGSNDRTIRVWDTESGQAIFEPFEGHTSFVVSVAFSPNGRHIISGSRDHTIRMWN
ncbi:WD40 repeat-like protein, partial [Fomitiporia mediterranea MF3/22]|uniref:WD40 repeat-like protein n=1 Tax=Fomitiporia mediterranea (strain MF3/22) TaxID=694068 RepID=UPI0004409B6B